MTYEELKSRLVRVESALQTISNNSKISKERKTSLAQKFNVIKESIQKQIAVLNEAVEFEDEKAAAEFAEKNPETPVKITKESSTDAPEDIEFDRTQMPKIALVVGKALASALKKLGDEIASMKAHRINVNSFDVLVIYKGEGDEDEFSFHIENGNLHIADFSYNEKLVEIGVKPSGEPIINQFNLGVALVNHFRNLKDIRSTNEDIDVGHQDNEPSMIKKQLYRIMKDAESLYNALGKYEGEAEVDFPSWWQSKITKSQSYLSGAHDYLDSEENVHEALDTPLPDTSKMSLNKLQKVYGMIVDRMLELNDIRKEKGLDAMYMGGSEPGKHSVRDHLISLTRKKKEVAGAIDDKVAGIGKGQELTNEGDLAYVADEDYQTIRNLIQFIDDHADNFEKNPQMEPALKFLKRLLREDATLNEMLRHSVIAKHDGYQLVKKSNTPELTIAKKGKSVGNFKTSGNREDDIKQFQKMIKSGKINEGTDLYDGDKFSMKRFAGPNGIALQITAPKLRGGGYEYIQIDGDTVKEFARAAVHVAQEFHDVDRQFPVNEFISNLFGKKSQLYMPKKVHIADMKRYVSMEDVENLQGKVKDGKMSPKQLAGINNIVMAIEEFIQKEVLSKKDKSIKFRIFPTTDLTDDKVKLFITIAQRGKLNPDADPNKTLQVIKTFIFDYLKNQQGLRVGNETVQRSPDTTAYNIYVPVTFDEVDSKK